MLGYIAIIFATASSVCSFWHREVDKLRRHRVVGVQGRPRVRGKEGKGHSLEQDVFGVTIIEAPRRKLARIKARCAHRFGGILRGATARVFERHIAENYVMEGPFAPVQRAAYSPSEFAALFGKSATWGYRQLYSGRVNAITGDGRLMIPASEVAKISGKRRFTMASLRQKRKSGTRNLPLFPNRKLGNSTSNRAGKAGAISLQAAPLGASQKFSTRTPPKISRSHRPKTDLLNHRGFMASANVRVNFEQQRSVVLVAHPAGNDSNIHPGL